MTALSFEFYPPKTDDQRAQLDRTASKLKVHAPEYVSCTFGAGGSTLSYTSETVRHLNQHHGLQAAPHLSCVGGTREEIRELLKLYRAIGVRRIVALRGDLPSGMGFPGDLRYASELIAFIRAEHGDAFRIEVGAYPETHPQASDALADLRHFKAKIDAGADAAITQYFYNADAYFQFVDATRKLGVDVPIVPGVMPISNFSQLRRFSEQCGAEIPRWIAKRMQAYGDDVDSVRAFGADVVAALCERLIAGGAPSLHFYTLNLARPTSAVLQRLGHG
ncbi:MULTISPECIES: methylenetetrahydrofolate reductase [NAD(P)H] [Stenotrophomonas]|jgi:methylenetetrahydrofolate reductase (NADPH)|uniref:Methylenetetrahydrofolate reductase n=1 Tax=Stenotrophomonas acidaminiphila TaxID=128780 RepID=A0A0R0E2T3_9GAMM|nr:MULTISPECIES: methylenetetrahydrofolate reductase [NAD(P)H] [Stenotrophomonas]OZB53046.1 MAG: methylenetetrahydrofolate reductase [NAD(P)H] [Stenotrophomonas sp. 14-69-23]ALJ29338.1 5,10-methylenetetrahydrofolate reductase [Stenotrophomonas acidaminiphila]KRG84088.1 5,10-methylenetetrahydrofolate reductase [Stenotrophomonas acidaminiphila]MCA7023266.1 methylenetetrahydrofolate reductase [NAD(P)H] [Stenotrophomonas acidaminiphila]MCE4075762.1 methylenetetrahydrofolate reductase [NAD(P)H] [St